MLVKYFILYKCIIFLKNNETKLDVRLPFVSTQGTCPAISFVSPQMTSHPKPQNYRSVKHNCMHQMHNWQVGFSGCSTAVIWMYTLYVRFAVKSTFRVKKKPVCSVVFGAGTVRISCTLDLCCTVGDNAHCICTLTVQTALQNIATL